MSVQFYTYASLQSLVYNHLQSLWGFEFVFFSSLTDLVYETLL